MEKPLPKLGNLYRATHKTVILCNDIMAHIYAGNTDSTA